MLLAGLEDHVERQAELIKKQELGENCADIVRNLNHIPVPLELEKDKPKETKDLT